jgi:hypothetical protein
MRGLAHLADSFDGILTPEVESALNWIRKTEAYRARTSRSQKAKLNRQLKATLKKTLAQQKDD